MKSICRYLDAITYVIFILVMVGCKNASINEEITTSPPTLQPDTSFFDQLTTDESDDSGETPDPDDVSDAQEESPPCSLIQDSCTTNDDCCSQLCQYGRCVDEPCCLDTDEVCSSNEDCCSTHCNAETLRCSPCRRSGTRCEIAQDCCSGLCDDLNGRCVACKPLHQPCSDDSQCCEGSCQQFTNISHFRVCSTCAFPGSPCSADDDCCGWATCSSHGFCGCGADQSPCTLNEHCCSNQCVNNLCNSRVHSDPGNMCSDSAFFWGLCSDANFDAANFCDILRGVCGLLSEGSFCLSPPSPFYPDPCELPSQCDQTLSQCLPCHAKGSVDDGSLECCSDLVSKTDYICLGCLPAGTPCSEHEACCTGRCDLSNNLCVAACPILKQ